MKRQLRIRVDANSHIGFGHLVRCVAIANAQNDFQLSFYSTDPIGDQVALHCRHSALFVQLDHTDDFVHYIQPGDLVLIDGYMFSTAYHTQLKHAGAVLLCIDDLATQPMVADLVINPTPAGAGADYASSLPTQFCMGLDYALLRPAFIQLAQQQQLVKRPGSLFICFGGSDPLNITLTACNAALAYGKFTEIHVVLGPGYTHATEMLPTAASMHMHRNASEQEMADLMAVSECGIVPCSGILLEGLAAKMKLISGFYVANQQQVYQRHLALQSFTDARNFSETAITSALSQLPDARVAEGLIDGQSFQRIQTALQRLADEQAYTLRRATEADTERTFAWANDPETRKFSFSRDAIAWDDHRTWFHRKITAETCFYGILEEEGIAVGSIRFDIADRIATISYLAAPEQHGRGIGTLLLKKGTEALSKAFTENDIATVLGYVLPENTASIKTFRRFGYTERRESATFVFTKKFVPHV